MNIYQKLNASRTALQASKLSKSGHNKFAGYSYFELGDFLPAINASFEKLGLFSQVSFTNEMATLTITDCDKPEDKIVFTSPMAEASLKGVHPIQNLGAVETYQRRYLYLTALEIVEHDALDASEPVQHKPKEVFNVEASIKWIKEAKTPAESLQRARNAYSKATSDADKEALKAIAATYSEAA